MIEGLFHLFAVVCGQNPGHTWAPGGMLLPCCQRCTGLYVGAGVAGLLHLWLRPRLSGRFLEIHGAFLIFMVPFGFHWVADGPVLRTVTGVLFGFGVVTCLWLAIETRARVPMVRLWGGALSPALSPSEGEREKTQPALVASVLQAPLYFLVLVATLVLLPLAASLGGALVAHVLCVLVTWGMLCLAALVVANVAIGLLATSRWCLRSSRITHHASRPRSSA
ncbi:MAG: DUF2085 domain-containing protein [Verrucomicrobiota bacterium]